MITFINKERVEWTIWRVWSPGFLIMFGLGLIGLIFSFLITQGPMWIMPIGTAIVFATLAAFCLVEYSRGGAAYKLHDVLHVWGPEAVEEGYYQPKKKMRKKLLTPWYRRWKDKVGYTQGQLVGGSEIHFVGDEPSIGWYRSDEEAENPIPDVDPDEDGIQSYGQTWAGERKSRVYAARALEMGVTGHELDLLAFYSVFPEREEWDEDAKVQWMKEKGIK